MNEMKFYTQQVVLLREDYNIPTAFFITLYVKNAKNTEIYYLLSGVCLLYMVLNLIGASSCCYGCC